MTDKIEINDYLKCEFKLEAGVTTSILNLNLEELVYEKMYLMFEKLAPANANLEKCKIKLQLKSDVILLETDFKKLGLTNEKMRNAYVKPLVAEFEDRVDLAKEKVVYYKAKLEIINDLIQTRSLELKIENNLMEED